MLEWVEPIASQHITVKELAPIVLAAAMWGPEWRGKTILALCDNSAVVAIVNKGSSTNREAMQLMRCLAFLVAKFDLFLFASHLRGVENSLADALSRNNCQKFFASFPQADPVPSPIPEAWLDLLILGKPDWNSRHWTELWSDTSRMV